jgi:hypothetical protein
LKLQSWVFAVSFGAALAVGGLVMMRRHLSTWRGEKNDPGLDDADRFYYFRRYRRRMQTSAMIAVIGVLIALGDTVLPLILGNHRHFRLVFGSYWGAVLLLTGWVIVMALSDLVSASAHSRVALSRVRLKQRELEKQLEDIRRRGSNGHQN